MNAKMKYCEHNKAEKDHEEIKTVEIGLMRGNIAKPATRKLNHPEDGPDVHQCDGAIQAEEDWPVLLFSPQSVLWLQVQVQCDACETGEEHQLQRQTNDQKDFGTIL